LDFILAVLFLVLYYVRPHEWLAPMAAFQPVTKVLALGLAVVIFKIGRRVHWRPHRIAAEFLRTPNDWALLAFTAWMLYAAVDMRSVWAEFYPLLAYYLLVRHAASTPRRMEVFMWVWLGLLLFISTMAVLSEYDIDPFGSASFTHGMYKGRLTLNLSIFNNPNALGHSVVMILPMIYFLGIWHRMLLFKELSLPLFTMPVWCLFWTQSKGAYISGAVGLLVSQTFGRPKWLQIVVVGAVYGLGASALMLLPRMHDLESVRSDAGVKGRLFAWNFAYQSFVTLPKGLGFQQFTKRVPAYGQGEFRVHKPTHSSYVEVGAELGKGGLLAWLSILYFSMRVLVLGKTETDQEERIRRLLFCLVVIYMASSWMTNISYRGTFFIQTAVVAAFASHLRRRRAPAAAVDESRQPAAVPDAEFGGAVGPTPVLLGPPAPSLPLGMGSALMRTPARGALPALLATTPDAADAGGAEESESSPSWSDVTRSLRWRRLAVLLLDVLLIYLMYRVVIRAWLYFMLDWTGV